MSIPLVLGSLWVVASAIVAMLPMQRQYAPGVALLALAPLLILWIGFAHGWLWTALGLFAFVSMYRNPLRYFWRRFRGKDT
ncbi:DUF2484 family protein [Thalassococcus lentus]|uniref:DUF2484 family protein n=1 Tax=Thalassococcus lentus TaxID=1210524 RepID=A0ABT4XTL2_9RHOB|nr:DUF2484 family protein [Thalassococcus lentus]MDA7425247.1 DUF2484 family protein [Thalassococcus lentus]